MIPPVKVAEVKYLLSQPGLSQRKIAVLAGVSRASVSAIASGRRPDCSLRAHPDDEDEEIPLGPAERCPSCGGKVYMPCRLCRVRSLKTRERDRTRMRARMAACWDSPRQAG